MEHATGKFSRGVTIIYIAIVGQTSDFLKSKIYHCLVRSTTLYGSEYWPSTEDNKRHRAARETKMLCWVSVIRCYDHIVNGDILTQNEVVFIMEKLM